MIDGDQLGDHPAHRGADDVRGADPKVIEQTNRVGGHLIQ
jgi:hypothetical protein